MFMVVYVCAMYFKDLLSEEALADRRDVQYIPCYSVESFILLALRADAF
jgi:hypothetical protein